MINIKKNFNNSKQYNQRCYKKIKSNGQGACFIVSESRKLWE